MARSNKTRKFVASGSLDLRGFLFSIESSLITQVAVARQFCWFPRLVGMVMIGIRKNECRLLRLLPLFVQLFFETLEEEKSSP